MMYVRYNLYSIAKSIPVANMEDPRSLGYHHLEIPTETGCAHGVDRPVPVVIIVAAEVLQ